MIEHWNIVLSNWLDFFYASIKESGEGSAKLEGLDGAHGVNNVNIFFPLPFPQHRMYEVKMFLQIIDSLWCSAICASLRSHLDRSPLNFFPIHCASHRLHLNKSTSIKSSLQYKNISRPSFIVLVNFLLYHEFRNKQKLWKGELWSDENIVIFIRTDLSHATPLKWSGYKPTTNSRGKNNIS